MTAKQTRSSRNRNTPRKPSPGSLGEMLDDAGFQPLGRRIKISERDVAKESPPPKWVGPVAEFLWSALPDPATGQWDHLFISAFESACQTLVALGEAAKALGGGIKASAHPALPATLPRWDDVATIVVSLAAQVNLLEYRHFTGARARPSPTGLRPSNIRAARGCGPAYLAPEAFGVFESLDLVLGARWTEQAETILWRDAPDEWGIDFTEDRRFTIARDIALASVPDDVAERLEASAVITEESIVEWLEVAATHAPTTKTRDDALKSLRFWSRWNLNQLFFRRWRLHDGWLSGREAERTLLIEHDSLSLNMAGEFAARYLPHAPFLFE
ncbi:hypothetical protein ELI49_24335 [Rhizobium ruizarguesonis]|uniref:hypothetical protein n=1 Tax=Rhizobium TaxID=379 RepID=UPI00102F49EA|nr:MULTISPECIES: hypothetical protein [Rhizobium]MBY2994473.1 hypothetical protein [Rhizobium leguminosarum]MBY3058901.1 hypothetical protein [Rhizobium leguminosarum]TAU12662.1 hypothetical protein ELI49_24335 [Rhizobium ruizarguesonis]